MYPWTYVVTDLGGNQLGEATNPDQRKASVGISRPSTGQFALRSDHRLNQAIRNVGYDVYCKAYFGATLMVHGPLTGYQRVAQQGKKSVLYTFSDPYPLRFPKRLLNKTNAPVTLGPTDRGSIAKGQIDAGNTIGETGVRTGTQAYKAGATVSYSLSPYKPLNELIAELAVGVTGFDWQLVPIEFASGKVCDWHAADSIGQTRSDVIFEYGLGKHNVTDVQEVGDLSTVANVVYHISETGIGAPNAPVVAGFDVPSGVQRGVYEDLASAQLTDQALRQSLVDEHVRVRKDWRQVIQFTPAVYDESAPQRVPQISRDFNVGDTVRARGVDDDGFSTDTLWFDGWFRIWGITHEPDKQGKITTTLTLVEGEG